MIVGANKCIDGEQLLERTLDSLKGHVYVPPLCFAEVFQLLVCCKDDVAFTMLFEVRFQETTWNVLLAEIEIQIHGIPWSRTLSDSVGSPGQVIRFGKRRT